MGVGRQSWILGSNSFHLGFRGFRFVLQAGVAIVEDLGFRDIAFVSV